MSVNTSVGFRHNGVVKGANVNFTGVSNDATPAITSDGQLLIGSTAFPNIRPGNLTSTGGTITVSNGPGTINIEVTPGVLPIDEIGVQAVTAPGTNPVVADGAGLLTINGAAVAQQAIPVQSHSIAANSLQIEVQRAAASALTNATDQGVASFNSAHFTVDASGWVSLAGGGLAIDQIQVDAATGPGVNPVDPDATGLVTITGGQVAAGTTANVIRSHSTALNSLTIEVQRSSAQALSTLAANGVSHYSSAQFSVDGDGFVTMANGLPISGVDVQANTPPGTDPVLPNASGIIAVSGAQVAAGAVPIQTNSLAANSYEIQVQRSSAQAVPTVTANGICHFNSGQFTVDADGFVSSLVGAAPWLDSAGGALANHTGYFATAAAAYTLPAGAVNGDMVEIVDFIGGGVVVTAQGGDLIRIGNVDSSVNGTATTTQLGDSARFAYRAIGQVWVAVPGVSGNWILA